MEKERKKIIMLALIITVSAGFIFLYGNFASGQEVATCTIDCQEYAASECDSKCSGSCFPAKRENVLGCELGTCFDPKFGICQERSLSECNKLDGEFLENPNDNKCQKGCCAIGERIIPSITRRECEWYGISKNAEIKYEEGKDANSCFDLIGKESVGACIYQGETKRACDFITKEACLKSGGEFAEGMLCSHPDLNTICEKQATAKCIDDDLYWFDSCGNKENIYDSKKVKSWNNGNVLSESQSCEIGSSGEKLKNQETCGNCNRLLGSVCGQKTKDEKLLDNSIDFVCKDMRCEDKNGNIRQNGESWCEYQSSIGVDEGFGSSLNKKLLRATDPPGSGHFRKICNDGEIIAEPCSEFRREICVEDKEQRDNGEIVGVARCIENKGADCMVYNETIESKKLGILSFTKNIGGEYKKCEEDPQCFLKEVNIDDGFHFGICAPKYPPGFDSKGDENIPINICGIASKTCVVTYIKNQWLDWECADNCKCENPGFTEQMNDFCMSLGDCGASVNYVGELSENYNVKGNRLLRKNYLDEIAKYSEPDERKSIEINFSAYSNNLNDISSGMSSKWIARYDDKDFLTSVAFSAVGGSPGLSFIGAIGTFFSAPGLDLILGIGDTKKKRITFECLPWRAPFGGAKCDECGKDGFKCTRYACQSLGTTCELKNEGSSDEVCIDTNPDDIISPKISPLEDALEEGYKYEKVSDSGAKIVGPEGCLKEYTDVSFGIKLDKAGYCAYDFVHTENYSDMRYEGFEGKNTLRKNHVETLPVPDLLSLGIDQYAPGRKEEFNIFIRCLNINGRGEDSKEYIMQFCIIPKEDEDYPFIRKTYPENEIAFNAEKIEGAVLVNEPATCKWSLDSNKKYDEMENEMECANSAVEREKLGWRCKTTFPVNSEENKFYILCKDQPIEVNESARNEMPNAYDFVVRKTKTPLIITSVKPNNETFEFGKQPATIDLEVETSGGVDGSAKCSLIIGNNFFPMESSGTMHKQEGLYVNFDKENIFKISCEDKAENVAEAESRFNALFDINPPVVTRVYNKGGNLIVITNEDGECAYVNNGEDECNFDFKDGKIMSGVEKTHVGELEKDLTYYIKCKDKYDKTPVGCSVVVRGGVFA